MFKPTRWLAGALVAALALAAFGAGVVGAKPKPSGKPDSGVLYSAITHTVGKTEYIAGNATDKLFGSGAATYNATVGTGSKPGTLSVTAKVIVFYKNGSLSGTATATITTNTDGTVTFSKGKINLTKGGGAEKGHSLAATFTGSGKAILGPFVFNYKGTYK
jgi:hypothetical protein